MRIFRLLPALACAGLLAIVPHGAAAQDTNPGDGADSLYPSNGPSWFTQGQDYFKKLAGDKSVCAAPTAQQSPVNISMARAQEQAPQGKITYDLQAVPPDLEFTVVKNDHTIEVKLPAGGRAPTVEIVGGAAATYKLTSFHFHHPSEHLLDGTRYPMEMHLVHEKVGNPDSKLVIARFLTIRPAQNLGTHPRHILRHVFRITGAASTARVPAGEEAELGLIRLGDAADVYRGSSAYKDLLASFGDLSRFNAMSYVGSLTTPKCTQNVLWFVELAGGASVTQEEVNAFKKHFTVNARPTQAILPGTAFPGKRFASERTF